MSLLRAPVWLLAGIALVLSTSTRGAEAQSAVDWSQFLARHDLVWNQLPTNWESGAFIGNGSLGAMIYSSGTNALQWDVGRSDVTDKGDRVAIGRFVLQTGKPLMQDAVGSLNWTPANVTNGTMRMDLWNAEVRGSLATPNGSLKFRSLTHATAPVTVIELNETDPGLTSRVVYQALPPDPARAVTRREEVPASEKNPEPTFGQTNDDKRGVTISWCQQNFKAGGGYVVAWAEKTLSPGTHHLFFFTIDYVAKGPPGPSKAIGDISSAFNGNFDDMVTFHRAWWHAYYPESFLSILDTRMESFYWIQMYKLGSATRADRLPIDLMGPWFRRTPWPRLWWNLNIQLTYWPVYTANRLELGESLIHLIDADRTNFINNVPAEWRGDSAGIGRSSAYNGVRSVPNATAKGNVLERGDLTWVLHNYWLQYRYSGDEKLLRDGLYPILRLSIGYYLHLLSPGPDGKLHLPVSTSPEYPKQAPDLNYDLSLLRWGLNMLLAANERFNLNDPLAAKWRDTLARLTPNPVDPATGLMVGAGQPFEESHRHYSHLFSIYPLHLLDPQSAADRPLIEKSLDHWASMPAKWRGYSYTGASAMSSWLGRREDAVKFLNEFLDKGFVKPNTMYTEAGPVIETPLSGAASIHEIVLQSWSMQPFGTHIRVFPAVPDEWKDVSFDKLLAQGAFEVSAVRRDGKTKFVAIKSLAGAPCRVSTSLAGEVVASGARKFKLTTEMEDGQPVTVVDLKKGETVLLTSSSEELTAEDLKIRPVAAQPGRENFYGSAKE